MFEVVTKLKPYFFSLREIDGNVSLDIKIPSSWRYEDITKSYSNIKIKVQDKNEKFNLVSIIGEATESGYEVVFTAALSVIVVNKEEEEKQILFQKKIKELQDIFKKESLDKLKNIKFEHGEGYLESPRMAEDTN